MKITITLFDPATGVRSTFDDNWSDELSLEGLEYQYLEGNYACDCNKRLFLGRAGNGQYSKEDSGSCGDTIKLERLVAHTSTGDVTVWPTPPRDILVELEEDGLI